MYGLQLLACYYERNHITFHNGHNTHKKDFPSWMVAASPSSFPHPLLSDMQAEHNKGCTPLLTGLILSSSPLCVMLLSPPFGYFVSQFASLSNRE